TRSTARSTRSASYRCAATTRGACSRPIRRSRSCSRSPDDNLSRRSINMPGRQTRFSTRRSAIVAASCAVILGVAPAPRAQAPRRLALVGGMLLDGYETTPIHHAAIVIEGNKIVQVGPAAQIKIPTDATVIDTSGRTMMPGMMEAHAHLAILGHGEYGRWFAWLAEHKAQIPPERVFEISAKQLLMAGVTSAIDLGGSMKESLSVRDRIARGGGAGAALAGRGPPDQHPRRPP